MPQFNNRRVVTGLDAHGRSTVNLDGPLPQFEANDDVAVIWATDNQPADNSGTHDCAMPFTMDLMASPGSSFVMFQVPAHTPVVMHATNTVDYIAILSGEVTLVLEEEEVRVGPGDLVVDRGVVHGWRNDGEEPCVAVSINLPAHPLIKAANP